MNEQQQRSERRSALDDFAKSGGQTRMPTASMVAHAVQPFEHIGAMSVAVRRDEAELLQRLKAGAAAAGSDWYYRYPVQNRKQNRTDWIEGPTIKLANELSRLYKNNEIDVRVQDFGDNWLIYARFIDLENGYSLTRPFQQRKSASKLGGDDDARRLDIALAIGTSKAIRNVIVNALQTFADFAFEEARQALVDKIGRDIESWRARTVERTAPHVALDRVEAVIGRVAADWLAPDIARVIAMMKAVSEGMATLDETFPPLKTAEEPDMAKTIDDALDAVDQEKESPSETASGGGQDGDGSAPDVPTSEPSGAPPETADADDPQIPRSESASAALRTEMIDKLLLLAADKQRTEQERLEQLDVAMIEWQEQLPEHAEFVRQCIETAASVASGRSRVDAARRYLITLKDKQP